VKYIFWLRKESGKKKVSAKGNIYENEAVDKETETKVSSLFSLQSFFCLIFEPAVCFFHSVHARAWGNASVGAGTAVARWELLKARHRLQRVTRLSCSKDSPVAPPRFCQSPMPERRRRALR